MILDVLKNSLKAPSRLIPVQALFGNCQGSRMPEVLPAGLTPSTARLAAEVCPTAALALESQEGGLQLKLDYGKCVGCDRCIQAAPAAFIRAGRFSCVGVGRQDLVQYWDLREGTAVVCNAAVQEELLSEIHNLMGKALNIRQLDAGSCNGCETEISALTNPYYDLERFGVHFVASPKHADMLLVTGPVTRNMAEAVRNTYDAVPEPKLVVAVGACGVSGGLFIGSNAVVGPVGAVIPVDAYIPGCPPTPAMLLAGILRVIERRTRKSGHS